MGKNCGNKMNGAQEMLECDEDLSPPTPALLIRVVEGGTRVAAAAAFPLPVHTCSAVVGSTLTERSPMNRLICFSEQRRCHVTYRPVQQVGAGAFGVVYKCQDEARQQHVAIKYIRIADAEDGIPQWALREIALLRRCSARHPNIISLLDIHYRPLDGKRIDIHLVLEFCEMDLKEYIKICKDSNNLPSASVVCDSNELTITGLPPHLTKDVLYQVLHGLDFLHNIDVAHRDLKPQNILLTKGLVKIADFGLGKLMFERAPVSMEVVTLHYRPPEVLLGANYSLAVDMWSVGCIFAEMCTNHVLLEGESEIGQLRLIFSMLGLPALEDWPRNCSVARQDFDNCVRIVEDRLLSFHPYIGIRGVDLMRNLLLFNPTGRHSTCSALQHEYFNGHISQVSYRPDQSPNIIPQMSHFFNPNLDHATQPDGQKAHLPWYMQRGA